MEKNSITNTINEEGKEKVRFTTQKLTLIGMFGAVSAILMTLDFPVPFFPPFVKMDFSELPIIIGGYIMGPLAGFMIILIKVLLNFLFTGSGTMGVGELANFLGSVFYMIPAALIYNNMKTKKGAEISLVVATLSTTVYSIFGNLFLIFPTYCKLLGVSMNDIVKMSAAVNPLIKDVPTLMVIGMVPFNLLKYSVTSVITFLLYKRIKKILHLI